MRRTEIVAVVSAGVKTEDTSRPEGVEAESAVVVPEERVIIPAAEPKRKAEAATPGA